MRDKEKKNRKGQETTIGKIIYGFLLFMPLIAIGVTCLTHFFNKEVSGIAEQSEVNYYYETNNVTSANDLVLGRIYHYRRARNTINPGTHFAVAKSIYNMDFKGVDVCTESNTSNYLDLYMPNANTIYIYRSDNILLNQLQNNSDYIEFDAIFQYLNNEDSYTYYSQSNYLPIQSVITQELPTDDSTNIFYYAVDKVTESPLFSWAQNSVIYTTTASTCTALSITTPFIPLLMSYWLIISVIYFLYDIALMLVWLIHRKIHELQESL